jgi:hypothetical protein
MVKQKVNINSLEFEVSDRQSKITDLETITIEWLKIKVEEYKTLRAEVLNSGSNSVAILQFGLVAISGLLYFGLSNWENEISSTIVFLVFCPVICYLILMVWIGEIARRFRASNFIFNHIENELNQVFNKIGPVLHWENWVRGENNEHKKKRLFKWHRASTVGLFFLTAIASVCTGLYKIQNHVSYFQLTLITITEYTIFASVFLFVLFVYYRITQW